MILLFEIQRTPFLIGFSREKGLSIAAPATKYIFVLVSQLNELRYMSESEKKALRETESIVKSLQTDEEIKDYVILELNKLSGVYKKELTVKQYEDWFKTIK